MNNIRIPIQNNAEILIGDIFISCNVEFKPMIPPSSYVASITVTQLNSRLKQIGYEIAAEITNRIHREIKEEGGE